MDEEDESEDGTAGNAVQSPTNITSPVAKMEIHDSSIAHGGHYIDRRTSQQASYVGNGSSVAPGTSAARRGSSTEQQDGPPRIAPLPGVFEQNGTGVQLANFYNPNSAAPLDMEVKERNASQGLLRNGPMRPYADANGPEPTQYAMVQGHGNDMQDQGLGVYANIQASSTAAARPYGDEFWPGTTTQYPGQSQQQGVAAIYAHSPTATEPGHFESMGHHYMQPRGQNPSSPARNGRVAHGYSHFPGGTTYSSYGMGSHVPHVSHNNHGQPAASRSFGM
jgi:hypothetical protein